MDERKRLKSKRKVILITKEEEQKAHELEKPRYLKQRLTGSNTKRQIGTQESIAAKQAEEIILNLRVLSSLNNELGGKAIRDFHVKHKIKEFDEKLSHNVKPNITGSSKQANNESEVRKKYFEFLYEVMSDSYDCLCSKDTNGIVGCNQDTVT